MNKEEIIDKFSQVRYEKKDTYRSVASQLRVSAAHLCNVEQFKKGASKRVLGAMLLYLEKNKNDEK